MSYIDSVNVGGTPYKIQETSYIAPSLSGTAYTAALANFTLATGATVQAKFSATNPDNATLNVNSTGAKNIFYNNAKIIANQFKANHTYTLVYDGTQWQLVGDIDTNTQTVTGVKGNSESNYRTGNVNITATNIGLGNVENTALSTWTGSSNVATVGTITSGTWHASIIGAAYGGTGQNTLQKSANVLINALDTGSSNLTANDYVITQYVGGGTATTSYHRRPASKVINTTLVKAALGTVNTTAKKFLKDTGAWTQVGFSDLTGTATNAQLANSSLTVGNKTISLGETGKLKEIQANPQYHVGDNSSCTYVLVTINKETSWMLSFTLRLYQGYQATDIQISGYNYGGNHWYSPQAIILGSTSTAKFNVYFGYTGDYKLWVAVDGSSYTGASVVDITNGFTQIDFENAITLTKVSALPETLQVTKEAYRPWYRNETVTNATNASAATTATKFASAQSITLTGDVTGTASSQAGWSLATTIGTGKVTNAMLAGSITNAKLANSKVTIAGNDVSLGGSLTAATLTSSLGLSNALHFIGITSTTLTNGSTTATLTAKSTGSLSKTTGFVDGDVVMDGDQLREYVWSGSAWRLLGITTSTAYTQPTSTATNTWIAQISQGTDGKITATTGSLNTSGTWSGTASKATTTANTSDSIYPVGVKSGATTTLLHDTSITMKGNTITAVTYNSTAASLTSETSTTANTAKYATLTLGNNANVNTTTAHSEGQIVIYSAATQAHTIKGTSTTTAYTHTLPNSTGLLVSLSSGTAKGSTTKPVYIPNTGIVTECSTYAGGTKVTFNGADKGASTASFYAPTAGGTAGHVLIGAGTTAAPAWYDGTVMSGTAAASWKTAFNGTTDASSTTAAAVTIAGGLGIAKSLIVGTTATITNNTRSPIFTLTANDVDKAYLQYNTDDDSIDFIFM